MKVLFWVYPSAFQEPGGGEVMLLKTKEALQQQGIAVKLFNQWEDKLKDYDILHIFGSVKDCLPLMEVAKDVGTKVVLSPIFWSTLQRALQEHGGVTKRVKMSLQHLTKVALPVMPSARRGMLELADTIVPNSEAEARQVSRLFAIPRSKMHVVYLGVDERFANAQAGEFEKKYKVKNFILSVGRIEPRKNQLNLLKALRNSGYPLVIIGNPVPGYEAYFEECKKASDSNCLFLSRLQHEDSLLASAYAASKVFVLQGWFETPGLAALEAGLTGTQLAVTEAGSTYEYFGSYAEYLNPGKTTSIRNAIERALKKTDVRELKQHIRRHFLWHNVAQKNIEVYQALLEK